jgi:hypothetical protein
MATSVGKDRPSKLLDALILHKPKPIRRKRGYTTFNDSTCDLMDDGKGLNIGEVNQSNLDSVESVISEVLYATHVYHRYIFVLQMIFYIVTGLPYFCFELM